MYIYKPTKKPQHLLWHYLYIPSMDQERLHAWPPLHLHDCQTPLHNHSVSAQNMYATLMIIKHASGDNK